MGKGESNFLTALWTLVIYSLWMTTVTQSETVTLDRYEPVTQGCGKGLRDQVDRFIFYGTVDSNTSSFVDFLIKLETSNSFQVECSITLRTCRNIIRPGCDCFDYNNGTYQVFMNYTATVKYSKAQIQLSLPGSPFSSGVKTVETIYANNSDTATVNGETPQWNSSGCTFSLQENGPVEYCCHNSPSPCNSEILFEGITVSGAPCAKLNASKATGGMYSFSHSVCGGSVKRNSCNGTATSPDCWCKVDWGLSCPSECIIIILLVLFLVAVCLCALAMIFTPRMICCCCQDIDICSCCNKYRRPCCENMTWGSCWGSCWCWGSSWGCWGSCCICWKEKANKPDKNPATCTNTTSQPPAASKPESDSGEEIKLVTTGGHPGGKNTSSKEHEDHNQCKRKGSNARPKTNQVENGDEEEKCEGYANCKEQPSMPTPFRPLPKREH